MDSMRTFLVGKQKEIQRSQGILEYQAKLKSLDRLASLNHHLVSTIALDGVYGHKQILSEFELSDEALWKSSGMQALKAQIRDKASKSKKFPRIEVIPEEDKVKFAQGPFLVFVV